MKKIFVMLAAMLVMSIGNAGQIQLTKSNTLVLNGPVTADSVSRIMEEARSLDSEAKSEDPLYLFLYTPGGSIQDGLELIESLNSLNRPVNTVTLFAASMGFQIAQNMKTRYIMENGTLMSHKAAGTISGEFGDSDSQLDHRYYLWIQKILDMDNQTVARSKGKQTLQSYRAAYENELWLTGKKAVSSGYADEVVSVRCDVSLTGKRIETVSFMGTNFSVGYSQCPTNTNILSVDVEVPTNKGLMTLTDFQKQGGMFIENSTYTTTFPTLYSTEIVNVKEARTAIEKFKLEYKQTRTRVIKISL